MRSCPSRGPRKILEVCSRWLLSALPSLAAADISQTGPRSLALSFRERDVWELSWIVPLDIGPGESSPLEPPPAHRSTANWLVDGRNRRVVWGVGRMGHPPLAGYAVPSFVCVQELPVNGINCATGIRTSAPLRHLRKGRIRGGFGVLFQLHLDAISHTTGEVKSTVPVCCKNFSHKGGGVKLHRHVSRITFPVNGFRVLLVVRVLGMGNLVRNEMSARSSAEPPNDLIALPPLTVRRSLPFLIG
uniref:Secreted protein n=1 Tax=Knipowitschia caucasica TaxID=637954 RepID=A0AAV2MFX0_KNICA